MIEWNGDAVLAAVRAATMRGVVRGTEAVREESTSLMLNSPRSGRIYRRRGVEHKASALGEPPAPDTGNLMRNIDTSYDAGALAGLVTFRTNYAAALEYGTSRMAPRPFARPALMNKGPEAQADIADEVAKALK